MKDSLKIALGIIIGVIGVAVCGLCAFVAIGAGGLAFLDNLLSSSSESPLQVQARITPQPIGSMVRHEDFEVTLLEYEFSGPYTDEYDLYEEPPLGAKFLWTHIHIRNAGENADYSPVSSDFTIIHLGKQINSDFLFTGRPGYVQYESGKLFPGIVREGWIRFTLPEVSDIDQITVVFNPFDLFDEYFATWRLSP